MAIKKLVKSWDKIIDQYDRDANRIQRQISERIKSEWSITNGSLLTPEQMKKILTQIGKLKFIFQITKIALENFSKKADSKLLRATFKLDALMCTIESDLEEVTKQNPRKKPKLEVYSLIYYT